MTIKFTNCLQTIKMNEVLQMKIIQFQLLFLLFSVVFQFVFQQVAKKHPYISSLMIFFQKAQLTEVYLSIYFLLTLEMLKPFQSRQNNNHQSGFCGDHTD